MFIVYDVLDDFSINTITGKSQFGELAHAKKRAVKDNKGKKIQWRQDSRIPGPKRYYGYNEHDELINAIFEHPTRKKNSKKRAKKKVVRKKNTKYTGYQIFGFSTTGELRYVIDNKHPVVTLGLVKTRTSANVYKSKQSAENIITRPGPLKLYSGWTFGVISTKESTASLKKFITHLGKA